LEIPSLIANFHRESPGRTLCDRRNNRNNC